MQPVNHALGNMNACVPIPSSIYASPLPGVAWENSSTFRLSAKCNNQAWTGGGVLGGFSRGNEDKGARLICWQRNARGYKQVPATVLIAGCS